MTRKTSFYYSFLVLPPEQRRAITAVFDFCRALDDSVDLAPAPDRATAAVELWRDEIARVFEDRPPQTPQGQALQPFVKPSHLPRQQFEALLEGVAMDATPRRFASFPELETYCHRVASSVGLICAEVFGYRQRDVMTYATDLGVALQLTNILRDVAVDLRRDRFYMTAEDLERFQCTEDDVRREVSAGGGRPPADRVRALLEHQAARARIFFARAVRALPKDDARRFVAAEIMREIYTELLRRIEARDFDVFGRVVKVPRPAQARIALRTWWRLR